MEENIVYIKAPMSVQVSGKKVYLKDIIEMDGTDADFVNEAENQVLTSFTGGKDEIKIFSILQVIGILQKLRPDIQIVSLGEPDFIVKYKKEASPKKWLEYIKLVILCLIVFLGAAFTIMTFNTDVGVKEVFDEVYHMVTGVRKARGSSLEISYCVGIFIGIMAFYNHFSKKKLKEDPTPIHVEMRNYEEEMNKAIMEDAAREEG